LKSAQKRQDSLNLPVDRLPVFSFSVLKNYQFSQIVNVEKMVKKCLLRKGNTDLLLRNGTTIKIGTVGRVYVNQVWRIWTSDWGQYPVTETNQLLPTLPDNHTEQITNHRQSVGDIQNQPELQILQLVAFGVK